MKTRIITGAVIGLVIALFIGLRLISPYFFDIFIAVVMICGAGEVSKVFNRSGKYNNMTLQTLFPVAVFITLVIENYFNVSFYIILISTIALFLVFTDICFIWTLLDKKTMRKEKAVDVSNNKYVMNKTLLTAGLFVYPTILLGMLFYINHIGEFGIITEVNIDISMFLIVILFITTVMTDTCAYFVGSLIKGKKLCPYISPNKTISGAIGGLIGSILGAILVYFIFLNITGFSDAFIACNLQVWHILIYGLVASVFSQAGDIFASWLKRRAKTKDFSTIFPGHGGFMDRCDGLSFNAVFTFILFAIIL